MAGPGCGAPAAGRARKSSGAWSPTARAASTGTGHGGEIHHVDARGEARLVAQVEAAEVFSLLLLPGGDLLAGCGPEGELLRVARRRRR